MVTDSLPPPPGWHSLGAILPAPHVADAQVGEIRGYARLPPPPGWRKCSPPVIVSAAGGVGGRFAAPGFALLWLRFGGAWGIVGTKKSMPKHRFQINPKT